jgi:hypothetical protein
MYTIYLNEEDLRQNSKYPIIALLNEAANENLVEFLENLNNNIGSGYNYTTAYFWEELDDFDRLQIEKFDGIKIETESGEEIIVSYEEMAYYLNLLLEKIPLKEDLAYCKKLLESFRESHNVGK